MKSIFEFLTDLKANNNREWFQANKSRYDTSKAEHLVFVEGLLKKFESFEPEIFRLEAQDCVFRINRDVRFSLDKSPYKVNFAAYFNRNGKKSWGPGYYLHLEPGNSFIAGGIWMPESDTLKKIRQEIDYNFESFKKILDKDEFKNTFGGLKGEKLSRPPKDYKEDNPAIEFLKYKSFELSFPVSDETCFTTDFDDLTIEKFKIIKPYNNFLSNALE
jgi:uncharacterized protein (TIGR02453 family)